MLLRRASHPHPGTREGSRACLGPGALRDTKGHPGTPRGTEGQPGARRDSQGQRGAACPHSRGRSRAVRSAQELLLTSPSTPSQLHPNKRGAQSQLPFTDCCLLPNIDSFSSGAVAQTEPCAAHRIKGRLRRRAAPCASLGAGDLKHLVGHACGTAQETHQCSQNPRAVTLRGSGFAGPRRALGALRALGVTSLLSAPLSGKESGTPR